MKPAFKAASAYLHPQSEDFKSANLPSQVVPTSTEDKFIIIFNISLLVIETSKLYLAGLEELSTITLASYNLLAAATDASSAFTPTTGLTIDITIDKAATEAVTFFN